MYSILIFFIYLTFVILYRERVSFIPSMAALIIGHFLQYLPLAEALTLSLSISTLLFMSYYDVLYKEIPHMATIFLLFLGFCYAASHNFMTSTITFVILSICLTVFFYSSKGAVGAGDLKVFIIFGLFFPLEQYFILFLVNTICDLVYIALRPFYYKFIGSLREPEKGIKYAPILSISFVICIFSINIIKILWGN